MSLDISLQSTENGGNTTITLFSSNITHNLGKMAGKAGIYDALWNPAGVGASKAKHIIPALEFGLECLKRRPSYYRQFDSKNGWGLYIHFVPFVEGVLAACKQYPEADISTST